MSYLIITFFFLAIFHFIYESIVAPSWRLSIRYKLFNLRDELRTLKIEHGDRLDDKHFHYLQDSINSIIFALPNIEIVTIAHIKQAVENDKGLKQRLELRQKILDDCAIPEVRSIRKKSIELSIYVLAANGAGWIIYLIPFMLVTAAYQSIQRRIKLLISLSELDLQKIAPETRHSATFAY